MILRHFIGSTFLPFPLVLPVLKYSNLFLSYMKIAGKKHGKVVNSLVKLRREKEPFWQHEINWLESSLC